MDGINFSVANLLTLETMFDVVLAGNKYGNPIAIGQGSVSQVIRCNNKGKWVAQVGPGKWIRVKDAFCYLKPEFDF
ncbi:unnamed protein product [Cylicostephanus goldi]|uniref:Uncharacterized protein n=1 Tax=Cylicostephanus goldi TaxID=71465 RepID=A0A3P6R3S5_CYLGO|nr:unnamed protein product [Cylicostephanus goldi]